MKEAELRSLCTCALCKRKLGQTGAPMFYKVTFETHLLNLSAIDRQNAFGILLRHGGLAAAMGPDEDLTAIVSGPLTFIICLQCATEPHVFAAALARGNAPPSDPFTLSPSNRP